MIAGLLPACHVAERYYPNLRRKALKLKDYARLALSQPDAKCHSCGGKLLEEDIEFWGPHSNGWRVEGHPDLIWLYFSCRKCGYQTSLQKLEVRRPVP